VEGNLEYVPPAYREQVAEYFKSLGDSI